MSEHLSQNLQDSDDDIRRMEELLNNRGDLESEFNKSQIIQDSTLSQPLDYGQPYAEIINTIQSIMHGELADSFSHDDLRERLYIWLSDYKKMHSYDDYQVLNKKLHIIFGKEENNNYKIKILFSVLDALI